MCLSYHVLINDSLVRFVITFDHALDRSIEGRLCDLIELVVAAAADSI